jgi:tetratricopeptide (TPR) repeat protein
MDEFVLKISNSYIYRNDISNILKARFYNFVGLIKTLLGDMEEAEKSFLEARALFMKEGDEASVAYTSIYLGNILRFFYGKLKEAIKFYEDFSKVFVPLNIFVQFQTGDTKSLMGDFKGAEENLRKIKFLYKFFPDYIRGVYDSFLEARILMRKKEFNSAISKFIESLEKNPGNPTDFYICLNLSLCYAFKNEMEKAYEYFNKSQQIYRYILDWERYEVQKIQGFLFLKEGKIDKAIKVFENLYYISNLSIEDKIFILYLYGRSLVINGKKEKGEKVLQEALDLCDKTEIKIFFKDLI